MECVAGCNVFYGKERKHHKDCPFYPESLSKMFDDLQAENAKLKAKVERYEEALIEIQDEEAPCMVCELPQKAKQALQEGE
jgi:regulator of replication initiation timing